MPTVPRDRTIPTPQSTPDPALMLMAAATMKEQGRLSQPSYGATQSPNWRVGSAFATLEGKM